MRRMILIMGLLSRVSAIIIVSISLNAEIAFAQTDTVWTRTFGGSSDDGGDSIQQTADGGYIISGFTESYGAGGKDVWLIKTDANGTEQWSQTYGGIKDDRAFSVKQTNDNGFILTGTTESSGAGKKDIWLIKTDANGTEQWNRTFGGGQGDKAFSIQQTADGGFVIAGETKSIGAGLKDIWLIKTAADGTEQWSQTFGGSGDEEALSVDQTTDGGYILAGFTESYGAGSADIWLIKTDASGTEEWNQTFGGTNRDEAWSVQQTADNGYIISGFTKSFGAGVMDLWLIKTDANGTEQWNRTFGGSQNDEGRSVYQTTDGGFVVVGYTASFGAGLTDLWLIKTDADGTEEWNRTFGGSGDDVGYSLEQTDDGGLILTGHTASSGSGGRDVWLIRLARDMVAVGLGDSPHLIPHSFLLHQNFPNPFNPSTTLQFNLPRAGDISLVVYDLLGREIALLVDGTMESGHHSLKWNGHGSQGREVLTGIYIARLVTSDYSKSIKMVLLK